VASLRYRANGWDLRYRDRAGIERTERFTGGTPRRAPVEAQERRVEVEAQMFRGTFVSREDREVPFRVIYHRWCATRQISATRRHTDAQRAAKHVHATQAAALLRQALQIFQRIGAAEASDVSRELTALTEAGPPT
jgi:hypothetical protein